MPVWEIYTYGNGEFLAMIFNGVVALLGDNNYVTLMRLAGIFGLFWVAMKAALYRGPVEWTYIIWSVLIYSVLFVPKVDVVIVDRLDSNQTRVVANVPWGLGTFTGVTAKIGDWFTRGTETVMSLPDDLKYHRNGVVFGSSLVEAASQFEITDGRLKSNMSEFMKQCVFYDILLRRYTWTQILEADDTWEFIKANTASASRSFAYIDAGGTQSIIPCQTGATGVLQTDWNAEVTRASQLYGIRFNPQMTMATASAKLMADLPMSYDFLAGISKNGGDIIRANMMANTFRRSFSNAASSADANAAAQDFATAQAEQQQRSTYAVMGQLASKFLPLLKNIYEGILYGVFPFIFLVFMLPIGVKVFFAYLKNIIWLQLWAPLYAVLNLLMTLHAQKASLAAASQIGGSALSLATHSGLAAVNADTAILAGYMGMSIPLIAYGLVSGGQMALSQFASQVASVAQSAAQQAGAAAATGNISLANMGAYNTNMFKYDTNAGTSYGQGAWNRADGATVTNSRDGSEYLTKAGQQLGASLDVSSTARLAKSESLAQLDQATQTQARQYADGMASSLGKAMELTRSTGFGTSHTDGWSQKDAAAYKDMYEHASQLSADIQKKHGFTKEQADSIANQAYADASVGLSSPIASGKIGTRHIGEHKDTDKISDAYEMARKSAESDVVKSGIEALRSYASDSSYQETHRGSNDLSTGLRSDLQDTIRHEKSWQAARTHQTQAQDAVQRLESADRAAAANLMYQFKQDLDSSGYGYRDQLLSTGNEEKLASAAQQWWVNKNVHGMDGTAAARSGADFVMNPGHGQMGSARGLGGDIATDVDGQLGHSGQAVNDAHRQAQRTVAGEGSVRADSARNTDVVQHKPKSAGDPWSGADSNMMFTENLGTTDELHRQQGGNLKSRVYEQTDSRSGTAGREIDSNRADMEGKTGVQLGDVESTINKGRKDTKSPFE